MFKCPKDQVFADLQTSPTTTYCTNSWWLSYLQGPFCYLLRSHYISSNLSWIAHIDSVCSKAKRQVGLLHRHFHNASPPCKERLYKSLVLTTLDYCSSLWDPNYATHVNKLESVQKFVARFVTSRWSDNYDSLLSHLNWPKLCTRRNKLLLCNRILNNCSILQPSLFTPHPSSHLRHNHHHALYYPTCHSTAHLSSFAISVLPLWNSLPLDVVCAPSVSSFKRRLNCIDLLCSYALFTCISIGACTSLVNFSLYLSVFSCLVLFWVALILAYWLGGYFLCTPFPWSVYRTCIKKKML